MYIIPTGSPITNDHDFNFHRYLMVKVDVVCVKEKVTVDAGYIDDYNEKLIVANVRMARPLTDIIIYF